MKNIRHLLTQCDAVLIGAGAGLTSAAGIDYLDRTAFSRYFPGWVNKGFTAQYELMGYRHWTQMEQWGYYKAHLEYVYYSQTSNPLYQALYQLVKDKDYFVMTSNVDGHFYKNGFVRERIYAPQGDYGQIQCTKPCTNEVWDIKPYLDRMEPYFDKEKQVLTSELGVPKCPHCAADMFIHARIDGSFIDEIHEPERQSLLNWFTGLDNKRVLLLDLGSGFNTPTVVRLPMEKITQALPNVAGAASLVLIFPSILSSLLERGLSGRLEIWSQAYLAIKEAPMLGYGINSQPALYFSNTVFNSAHNRLLSTIYYTGITGGLLLIAMLVTAFWPVKFKMSLAAEYAKYLLLFGCLCSLTEGKYIITRPDMVWLIFWLPLSVLLMEKYYHRQTLENCTKNGLPSYKREKYSTHI